MQSAGFAFCACPALEALYKDPEERAAALIRTTDYANTHPVMTPLLVGIAVRLEFDLDASQVMAPRLRVMSALAAWGDRIFWNHLKPLASALGTLVGLTVFEGPWGAVILLLVYNVPSVAVRRKGFRYGCEHGLETLRMLRSAFVDRTCTAARRLICAGLGMTVGAAMALSPQARGIPIDSPKAWPLAVAVIGLAIAGSVLRRLQVPMTAVVYLIGCAAAAISFMLGL